MKIVIHACGKDVAPAYIFAVSGSMQVCEPTCRGAGGEFNGSSCLLVTVSFCDQVNGASLYLLFTLKNLKLM
jgi:hypothetical protein